MAKIMQEPPETEPCPEAVREDWKERALLAHNWLRRRHGVLDLEWSDECYENAKRQADACQAAGRMLQGHCEGTSGRHGQNIYWTLGCGENVFPEGTAVPKPPRSHVALAKAKAAALRPKAVGKSKGKAKHLAEPEAILEMGADGLQTLTVRAPSLAVEEFLEDCPWNFKERIEKAFQEGADAVVIDRLEKPPQTHIRAFTKAYSAHESTVALKEAGVEVVVDYEPTQLSTIMLFFTMRGTVFTSPALWVEQFVILALFVGMAAAVHHFGIHDEATSKEAGSFADKMATLAAFLLGFYTSLTVSRLFISQFVTRDPQILGALRRYARGSLSLVFLKRRYGADFVRKLDKLVDDDIFTLDEVEQLRAYNSNLAESVWTWVAHIVADLYKKGQIKSEMMLTFLMERSLALIGAQMGTPIPLPYVHFIGFLVKIHNIILGLSYGYMMGTTWKMDHFSVSQVFLTLKVFFIPLLYNAILLVNASLADPFSGEVNDFPWQKYQKGIESDGFSYIQAGEHLPMWMK
eukprot:g744.t1